MNVPKIEIAERTIRGLQKKADIKTFKDRWQNDPLPLRGCDIIFGCVDKFSERKELEACARRFLIPYIDIGIDVTEVKPEPPIMSGQVMLSMPGQSCLHCLGFLNDKNLAQEAGNYGAAGNKPQVVWANGIVASLAVGIAVDLVTGWTGMGSRIIYLSYEGNKNCVAPHVRLKYLDKELNCVHYPSDEVGNPVLKKL